MIGLSSRAEAPGNYSRFCEPRLAPDSHGDPEGLAGFLVELGRKEGGRGILFPTRDADVLFLDVHRARLEPWFAIPQPDHDALNVILDKARLAERAEAAGIATPRTRRVSTEEEIDTLRDQMPWPAVVKPVYAQHWREPGVWEAVGRRKGIPVENPGMAKQALRRVQAAARGEVLIQEWVSGAEDQCFVVGAYVDRLGVCRGAFTAQKLLQYPPEFGLGCLVRSVRTPDLAELGTRLLKALDYRGIAEVEFKRDARTGEHRLIEVNPRHWDQHTLASACGVNVSYLAYCDYCEVSPSVTRRPSQRTRYWVGESGMVGLLKEDLRAGRRRVLSHLFRLLAAERVYALWSWRDPGPSWNSVWRFDR